jgi:hypothetical protein
MSLCIIIEVTTLNISFYVVFVFLFFETCITFRWMLNQLVELYQNINISNSIFIVTNCDDVLINVIELIFLTVSHALCLWYVDKNVLKNCRLVFEDVEFWTTFYDHWHKMIYVSFETIYEKIWLAMQNKYEDETNHWLAIEYLKHELLNS